MEAQDVYDLKSIDLPYLTGAPLRMIVRLLESPAGGAVVGSLLRNAGVTRFREQPVEAPPTVQPLHYTGELRREAGVLPQSEWPEPPPEPAPGFRFATVHDYAAAYRDGRTTPLEVAERALAAIAAAAEADPPQPLFVAVKRDDVLRQAEAATARLQRGEALSVLDGVPVAVKDEVDMAGYATTVCTAFLGGKRATEDATVVARLAASGAMLLGKTNMHEIGIGVTGLNRIHGTPRNPYHPGHYTGGSSSGSAAAVASGLCPLALGADGGGSIRIPASFCGVVGLKPTFGRVSEHGAFPLDWSLAHKGPLAATATDAALGYAVLAGPDPRDPMTWHQPEATLDGWNRADLSDLTLGVYWPWFRHAAPEVVAACEQVLEQFQLMGATVRDVVIPQLDMARVAHIVTIGSEMRQALQPYYDEHRQEHGLDVRLNLALAGYLTATDYVRAQRVRTQTMAHFADALEEADVIITPATGVVAPPIPTAALEGGESDLSTLTEIMRFATPSNLTGHPAIAFPAGYTPLGLPVGMQVIGRPWAEATLLRLALAAERVVERKRPVLFHDLLG